jgi:transposase
MSPWRRAGPKKAAVAVVAILLRVVYHMLKDGTCYQELGEGYRRPRNPARAAVNLANRIRALGYPVDIRRAA